MASTIPLPRQQRLLQLLRLAEGELSAQALHHRLRDARQGMGLATVYRGLKLLQGFRPLFHTFEIHGLCSRCQQVEVGLDG
jgi:Fe2+ or Zn2+ uptake regulation protein